MKGYKLFAEIKGELYPWNLPDPWLPYSKEDINTRADGCGPFACFKELVHLKKFIAIYPYTNYVIYKIDGKLSKAKDLWDGPNPIDRLLSMQLPHETVLIDEFEILEKTA